jgi:hypothetical protein
MGKQKRQMPTETPDVSHIANPDTAHEQSDVDVGLVFKFIIGLFVTTIAVLFLVRGMYQYFDRREEALELPPASRVNPPGTRRLPPAPRLQGAPEPRGRSLLPLDEMKKYRAEEEARLNGYGVVDKQAGVYRIPIEQAKQRIVERGLPTRGETTKAPAESTAAPAAKQNQAGTAEAKPEESKRQP